jgi:hypothetical protein
MVGQSSKVAGVEGPAFTGDAITLFAKGKPVYGRKWHFRALAWFGP